MEPTLPSPHGSPEIGPVMPHGPEAPQRAPEHVQETERSVERPAPQEQRTGAGAGDTPPPMPVVPLPTVPQTAHSAQTQQVQDDDSPIVAADDDLIEKEWVEKAKRVISETKNDPFAQEQAVSRLQADYLQKRYGKVIQLPREE